MAIVLVMTITFSNVSPVQAARGTPDSTEFGFGAIVYMDGPYLEEALQLAVSLQLDWVALPVSWAAIQPDIAVPPRFDRLDRVVGFAAQHGLGVLISLSTAPAWAMADTGPDPQKTASFVQTLIRRFPEQVQAVELFPGANTQLGWGRPASAHAYLHMFQAVASRLEQSSMPVLLAAGGLHVLESQPQTGSISDLVFLEELYALGAESVMPVISIQYPDTTGDPLQYPDPREPRAFRHYEEVRKVMVKNHHQKGRIWITRFGPPSGKIHTQDTKYYDTEAQVSWISRAFSQVRSQLYIGAGILNSINPELEGAAPRFPCLLQTAEVHHPFTNVLRKMIALNQAGSAVIVPGRAKEGNFEKNRP